MNGNKDDTDDLGPPLPDFRTQGIQLQTIAPVLGVPAASSRTSQPDYLDTYESKTRGFYTLSANTGMAYLVGIGGGGLYGFQQALKTTPSTRWRVQMNSILNQCGRYGSRAGNTLGVFAVLYSIYEVVADWYDLEEKMGARAISPTLGTFVAPCLGAVGAGVTYYAPSGVRAAALAGTIGFGAVGATYASYSLLGIPYGYGGFLFF